MKLSEEMDPELNLTSRNNGDAVPANNSLKISKTHFVAPQENLESHISNGHGSKYPDGGSTNGHSSTHSPALHSSNLDALGFEVESYNDFNSVLSPERHSEKLHRVVELDENNVLNEKTFKDGSSEDNTSDIEKVATDISSTEQDLMNDSSHLSEEFQLRLSDDDDISDMSQNSNLRISAVDTVSSTTTEAATEATSLGDINGDGDSLPGSGTLEGTTLANDSLIEGLTSNSNPNDSQSDDSCQTMCSEAQNIGNLDKDNPTDVNQKIQNRDDNKDKIENPENGELSSCASGATSEEKNDALQKNLDCKAVENHEDQCKKTLSPEVTSVLSLDDKLEAELEAELQAEIAAEMQIKDKEKNVVGKSNTDNVVQRTTVDGETNVAYDVKNEFKKCVVSTLNEKSLPPIESKGADIKWNVVKEEPVDMAEEKDVLKVDVDAIKLEVEDTTAMKWNVKEEKNHDHDCRCGTCTIEIDDKTNIVKLEPSTMVKTEKSEDLDEKLNKLECEGPSMKCIPENAINKDTTKTTKKDEVDIVSKESETLQGANLNVQETLGVENQQELLCPKPKEGLPSENTENEETRISVSDQEPIPMNPKKGEILLSDTVDKVSKLTTTQEPVSSVAKQNEVLQSGDTSSVHSEQEPLLTGLKVPLIANFNDKEGEKSGNGEVILMDVNEQTEVPRSENADSGEIKLSEGEQEPLQHQTKVLLSENVNTEEDEKSSTSDQQLSASVVNQNKVLQGKDSNVSECEQKQHSIGSKVPASTIVNPEKGEKTSEQTISNCSGVLQGEIVGSEEARMEGNEEELFPSSVICDKKIGEGEGDPSNSALPILSEPNSPVSDIDYECPVSESDDPASIEISENGGGISNDDDSDTMCGNDLIMTDETHSEIQNESGKIVSGVDKVSSSELKDSDLSASPNFCDSTVLDASSNDDFDSQDCSSSANENTITKGHRKRTLSQSEDDSCSSFKSKKLNKLSKKEERNTIAEAHHDNGHKRPAEVTMDSDSKKLRVIDDGLSKELNNLEEKKDNPGQMKKDKLSTAASSQEVLMSEPPQESSKFASDRAAAKKAIPSANTEPTDLPFLRKLHKKELSKMSRSDLEELVLQKICEAITERSVVGDLRLRCQALENRQEKENEKFNKLRKQMTELSLVMRKYLDNQKHNVPAPPIKVTRSVGLQVCQGVRPVQPACQIPFRGRCAHPHNLSLQQLQPGTKVATSIPSKPDSSLSETAPEVHQGKTNRAPVYPGPLTTVGCLSDPPALVPTGSQTAVLVVPGRPAMTPPRVPIPPLQQISGRLPRFGITNSTALAPSQVKQIQQKQQSPLSKQSPPQNSHQLNQQKIVKNDVEVIDIIDKDDLNKKPAGAHVSVQQQQHQQKQAANAAAQSLAGNSGMTVRLIPPIPVSQPSAYSQLLVPSGTVPSKMILTASPPGNGIRGNLKLVMKGNSGNVIIPFQQNNGVAVSSSVVHIPSSTQAAVQQIFTNASMGNRTNTVATVRQIQTSPLHPAPLPTTPLLQANNPAWRQLPPRPNLKIQHQNNGIVLSWNMALGPAYADIESYQLFAYQEGVAPPSAGLWKKVGDVKALPLPMACTLTQFVEGHRYHFSVRAVDKHGRVGPFSQQGSIRLGN